MRPIGRIFAAAAVGSMALGLAACTTSTDASGGSSSDTSTTKSDSSGASKVDTSGEQQDWEKAAVKGDGTKTIYLVSKGFQHRFWQAVKEGAEQAGEVEARVDDVEVGVLGLHRGHRLLEALVALEEGVALLEEALGGQAVDAQAVPVFETRQGLVVQGRDDEDIVAEKPQLLAQAVLVAFDAAQVGQEELHEDRDLDGTVSAVSH